MRKPLNSYLILLSVIALGACSSGAPEVEISRSTAPLTAGALTATLTVNSDWGTGYCAEVRMTNTSTTAITGWIIGLDIKQSTLTSSWNSVLTPKGGSLYDASAPASDPTLWGGSVRTFGFCASSAQGGTAYRPVLTAATCAGSACVGGSGGTGGSAGAGGATGTTIEASKVLGQPTKGDTVPNQIVANRGFHTQGMTVQRNGTDTPDRVFVVDSGNQRVLGFKALGTCSNNAARECTNDGECTSSGTCVITGTRNADISIGQPNLTTGTCNGDNTRSMPASASSLCLLPYPKAISLLESPSPMSIAVDSAGAVYVPDMWNHRVLKFNDPFGTDRVADRVWGQANFTDRACNQGSSQPSSSTLCLNSEDAAIHFSGDQSSVGVAVDPSGKVWVTDQGNGRVLRFPANSNVADLVLGQADFNTGVRDPSECALGGPATGKKLCYPKAVQYEASTNRVYVLDWRGGSVLDWTGAEYRVFVYQMPTGGFTNGMAATEIISGTSFNPDTQSECWTSGSVLCLRRPTGFELVPTQPGAFWLNDSGMSRILYIDKSTGTWKPRKVLSQPNLSQVGDVGVNCAGVENDSCLAQHPAGGIGIDSAGNVYIGEGGNHRIMRYPGNIPDAPVTGGAAVSSNAILFPIIPGNWSAGNANKMSGAGFSSAHVVRLVGYPSGAKQLIARDSYRVLYWDNYDATTLQDGAIADGVLYQPDLVTNTPNGQATQHIADIDFDAQGRVYVAVGNRVDVFQGPITTGQQPLASLMLSNLPFALNQGNTGDVAVTGIAWQSSTQSLFVADVAGHRVMRVSSPFGTNPVVDLVLGQRGAENLAPNRNRDTTKDNWDYCPSAQADSFANLGELRFDRLGNLYVTDMSHEGWQCSNNRILQFDASQLTPDATHPFFCGKQDSLYDDTAAELADPSRSTCGTPRAARRVYGPENFTTPEPSPLSRRAGFPTFPFAVTFDAQNRMILSVDAYGNVATERVYYYSNPVPACNSADGCAVTPTAIFPGTHSQPASVSFDNAGNLAILDHTWNRILFYRAADVSSWISAH